LRSLRLRWCLGRPIALAVRLITPAVMARPLVAVVVPAVAATIAVAIMLAVTVTVTVAIAVAVAIAARATVAPVVMPSAAFLVPVVPVPARPMLLTARGSAA
jgi:hypothetical protein